MNTPGRPRSPEPFSAWPPSGSGGPHCFESEARNATTTGTSCGARPRCASPRMRTTGGTRSTAAAVANAPATGVGRGRAASPTPPSPLVSRRARGQRRARAPASASALAEIRTRRTAASPASAKDDGMDASHLAVALASPRGGARTATAASVENRRRRIPRKTSPSIPLFSRFFLHPLHAHPPRPLPFRRRPFPPPPPRHPTPGCRWRGSPHLRSKS
jgi:hypothetical protein